VTNVEKIGPGRAENNTCNRMKYTVFTPLKGLSNKPHFFSYLLPLCPPRDLALDPKCFRFGKVFAEIFVLNNP